MVIRWKRLFAKGTVWLTLEVVLNLLGTDTLMDYSEFLQLQTQGIRPAEQIFSLENVA